MLYRRLRALGITAPGSAIALVGGVLAANALLLSAMFEGSTGRLSAEAGPALARTLADLSFLTGGPAYSVMFALFVAGVSVPSLLAGLLSRAVSWGDSRSPSSARSPACPCWSTASPTSCR